MKMLKFNYLMTILTKKLCNYCQIKNTDLYFQDKISINEIFNNVFRALINKTILYNSTTL